MYVRAKLAANSVSFATVYRAFATLAEAEIVKLIIVDDGPARFMTAPETDRNHLIDFDSGQVLELASKELVALRSRLEVELGYVTR